MHSIAIFEELARFRLGKSFIFDVLPFTYAFK